MARRGSSPFIVGNIPSHIPGPELRLCDAQITMSFVQRGSLPMERCALYVWKYSDLRPLEKSPVPLPEQPWVNREQVYTRESRVWGCSPWQKEESGYREPRVSSPIIKMPLAPRCVVWIPLRLTTHCPQTFNSLIKEADTSELLSREG